VRERGDLERVRRSKNGECFAFSAFGTNIYEKRGDKWLIVHHHASKVAVFDNVRAAEAPAFRERASPPVL
jgi:hypothetical protein